MQIKKKTSKVKQRNKWAKKNQKQNNSIYQNVSEGIKNYKKTPE